MKGRKRNIAIICYKDFLFRLWQGERDSERKLNYYLRESGYASDVINLHSFKVFY